MIKIAPTPSKSAKVHDLVGARESGRTSHLLKGLEMKVITKRDVKRMRRAIRIADRANDYQVVEWAWGDIEATLDKIEARLEKAGK